MYLKIWRKKIRKGFTLVEIIISISIFMFIIGAVMKLFHVNQTQELKQSQMMAVEQKGRMILDYLTKDIKNCKAGSFELSTNKGVLKNCSLKQYQISKDNKRVSDKVAETVWLYDPKKKVLIRKAQELSGERTRVFSGVGSLTMIESGPAVAINIFVFVHHRRCTLSKYIVSTIVYQREAYYSGMYPGWKPVDHEFGESADCLPAWARNIIGYGADKDIASEKMNGALKGAQGWIAGKLMKLLYDRVLKKYAQDVLTDGPILQSLLLQYDGKGGKRGNCSGDESFRRRSIVGGITKKMTLDIIAQCFKIIEDNKDELKAQFIDKLCEGDDTLAKNRKMLEEKIKVNDILSQAHVDAFIKSTTHTTIKAVGTKMFEHAGLDAGKMNAGMTVGAEKIKMAEDAYREATARYRNPDGTPNLEHPEVLKLKEAVEKQRKQFQKNLYGGEEDDDVNVCVFLDDVPHNDEDDSRGNWYQDQYKEIDKRLGKIGIKVDDSEMDESKLAKLIADAAKEAGDNPEVASTLGIGSAEDMENKIKNSKEEDFAAEGSGNAWGKPEQVENASAKWGSSSGESSVQNDTKTN